MGRKDIVTKANSEIKEDKIFNIPNDKKVFLRNFAAYYYRGKSYYQLRPESPRFENTLTKVIQRISFDSLFTIPKVLISGANGPFGEVHAFNQQINNESFFKYSNSYYGTITKEDKTVNADLTALLSYSIEKHLKKIGISSNTGSILIVDNNTGAIISNACSPYSGEKNEMEIPYFVGSVKKAILAYAALAIDPAYFHKKFNGKSFSYFLEWSDDNYAAALLKDLMLNHKNEFMEILFQDFSVPFTSNVADAYFEELPDATCYSNPLDYKNYLFRISIGQEKPYSLTDVVKWYARIASGKKLLLNSSVDKFEFDDMSINKEVLNLLKLNLELVIKSGTASIVGNAFKNSNISLDGIFGKTGTAQYENEKINRSSSLILCTEKYTIGIAIKGRIPSNNDNLAAKNLMVSIIPILKQHGILP